MVLVRCHHVDQRDSNVVGSLAQARRGAARAGALSVERQGKADNLLRAIGRILQDARSDGLRVSDGLFQGLNRRGGHIHVAQKPPPFVAAPGDELFLQHSMQDVVVFITTAVFGKTVIRGKIRQADCRTKNFLLIRDTPSEEVYVLNMFPMRGSRI